MSMPIHWILWVAKVAGLVPVELYLLWRGPFMEKRKCCYTSVCTLWLGLRAGSMTQFLNQFSDILVLTNEVLLNLLNEDTAIFFLKRVADFEII